MRKTRASIIAVVLLFCLIAGFQAACFLIGRTVERGLAEKISSRFDVLVKIEGFKFNCITGTNAESIIIVPRDTNQFPDSRILVNDFSLSHCLTGLIFGQYRPTGIDIKQMEAIAEASFIEDFFDIADQFYPEGRLPKIKIRKAGLWMEHPFFAQGLEISGLSAKTLENGHIRISTRASFDSGKNPVQASIMVMPGQMKATAQLSVSEFDPFCLDAINLPDFPLNLPKKQIKGKITGRISACYCHATKSLVFTDGRFEAAGSRVQFPSAGLDFEKSRIKSAWAKAEARKIDLSLLNLFDTSSFLPEQFRTEISNGTFNARGDLNWNSSTGMDWNADITVESGSALLPELETRIDSIDADLRISFPGRIHIRQSRGRTSNGGIHASGHLDWNKDFHTKNHFIEIELIRIEPNKQIKALLPGEIQKAVDNLHLQQPGINGKIAISSGSTELDLEVYAKSARLPNLPFVLKNPSARIQWQTGLKTVRFENAEARLQGKTVEGNGVLHIGKPVCADFTIFGRYLPITPEILDWLGIDSEAWEIQGKYDLELRAESWRSDTDKPLNRLHGLEASVDIRDLSVTHPVYGQIADTWYGHLAIAEDGLRLADFRGNIFNTGVVANGTLPVNGRKQTRLRVESKKISINKQLLDALPEKFAGIFKKFDVRGQGEIQTDLEFRKNKKLPSAASVTAIFYHLETNQGPVPMGANGSLRAEISKIGTGNLQVDGFVELSRISAGRLSAERLSATFQANKDHIEIPGLQINAYGGTIAFTDIIVQTQSLDWEARIIPAHIDVETMVSAFGIAGRKAPAGSLRGQINLEGTGFDLEALKGSGEIKVDRGRLYHFPVLASVFRVLDLQMPRQSPVTDAYGTFSLKEGRFDVEDLLLLGGTMPMHAAGFVGLKNNKALNDQDLNLLVTTTKTDGLLNKIPVIGWVKHYTIDWFRRLAFQARVTGTIGDYEVRRLASPVTTPIERMWSLMEMLAPSPAEN